MKITIIIPTFNEAPNIADCLQRTQAAHPDAEILVVDGGSDETEQIVKEFSERFPMVRYIPNRPDYGKGHAICVGIESACGDILVQLDADLQFYPEEIVNLITPINEGRADFVLGSRFTRSSRRSSGSTPLVRSFGNVFISTLTSFLFAQHMTDVLAGFKAWKKEVTRSFEVKSKGYSYEVELPVKAYLNGWRLLDVPVTTEPRTKGVSSVSVVKVGAKIIFDLIYWKCMYHPRKV